MTKFTKFALGALMMAGAATAVSATPAAAQVSFGIGIGPAYGYRAVVPRFSCDPYSYYYDAYRCGYYAPYYPGYAYGPSLSFRFGDRGYRRDYDRGREWRGGERRGGERGRHR
jgi:hypothetical protein